MQRPAAPCTVSSGRRRRSAEGDQMGQQEKAMAGMAESTLLLEVCKQRLQDSGRGHARAAPRRAAALNDPTVLLGA